jgi:non-heme chloroperoxidase
MAEDRRVPVRDVTLHVVEAGDDNGALVVMIHGVMMSGRFFHRQFDAFPRRHVLVPDLRGHGDSEKPWAGHTVANYARDVKALVDSLGGGRRPVLVGWSMGAMVAWDYLRQFGSTSARALVVVDQPPSDFAWPDWEFGALPLEQLRDMVELLQTDRNPVFTEFQQLMLHRTPTADDAWILEEMAKVPPVVASTILCNQTFQDYRALLPSLDVPTLVCFGADEKLTSPRAGEYIVAHMPQAELRVFDRSSHMPFYEEPDAFNQVVEAFMEALPPE